MKKMMGMGCAETAPVSATFAKRWFGVVAIFLALILGCFQAAAEDWPKFGRDLGNTGRSQETGITSKNVNKLATKWTYTTANKISTTPAVATVNGTPMLYVASWDGVFHAVNAVTGQQVWSFPVDVVGGQWCPDSTYCRMGSSPAVDTSTNMVFFGSANAYLYALDAVSGTLIWKQSVGDSPTGGYEVWSSPTIYQGMVYIGVSSHGDDPCIPGGEVQAYDEVTGNLVWSFNTLDQSTCPNGGTCVGASVWASVAIDDANGIVYAGTGNPGASCSPPTKNAGLYPDSILALSASTGTLLNYFQALKNDMHDKDFGASPVLHLTGQTNQCTGKSEKEYWVTEGSKDGYVYIVGRNAQALTGTVQEQNEKAIIIASAAIDPSQTSKSCGQGKKIISYTNKIFVPGYAGFWVYEQNAVGTTTLIKKERAEKSLFGQPASIEDVVFFGGSDGNLYVSSDTGKILTQFAVGPVVGGIAISGNRVYFGTTAGNIDCMSVNGQ
jgi:glucose dehydrogenase